MCCKEAPVCLKHGMLVLGGAKRVTFAFGSGTRFACLFFSY